MSMRRFFRAQRDEDYSQIQYLTAKCTRLSHDKGILDRDVLVSRERERRLQNELEAAAARLFQQEQLNAELRMKQDQLSGRVQQQQELLRLLQQRVVLVVEESARDAELLRQVGSELLALHSSEVKMKSLVEELHAEAQHHAAVAEGLRAELRGEARQRAALSEGLRAELHRKSLQLEEQRDANRTLRQELEEQSSAHQKEVGELQQENEGSLRKLQETARQFEWLCQQQRHWMCCVKRFKQSLMDERDALLQQVNAPQKKIEKLTSRSHGVSLPQSLRCPLQDTEHCEGGETRWDVDEVTDPESRGGRGTPYEELCNQAGREINGHQKPP